MWSRREWNHNRHYHPLILKAAPDRCERALDVGCGEGILARELSEIAGSVTAIDVDELTLEHARGYNAAANIEYILGDFRTHPFDPESFDLIASVAALHHMAMVPALERMASLLRPAGRLAIVGLAWSNHPRDLPIDLAGAISTRLHRLTKRHREVAAPTLWPPPHNFQEVRQIAESTLPGVRYRRHVLWRYSLVWTKPG